MSTTSIWPWVMVAGLVLVGCGKGDDPMQTATVSSDDGGGSSTSGSPVTTTIDPSDTTLVTTATTGGNESSGGGQDSSGTGVVFLQEPDGHNCCFYCDLFGQMLCPKGEKCMPWASDGGGVWNSVHCAPIDDDPGQPGDECTVEGSATSGIDSCDFGVMCWNVDPQTNMGTCVPMCTGDESNPICEDPATGCAIDNDGDFALCLPYCVPILQDCPEGQACYGLQDAWFCAPDASGDNGVSGDPCGFFSVCDPGYVCMNDSCTAVCDLADPMGDAQCEGQACLPWYPEGSAPPGYENVGFCALPP